MEDTKEVYRRNLLNLVEHHRAHCTEDCNVSLTLIRLMMIEAGYTFSEEEYKLFI